MSYNKTFWFPGDIITDEKWNNILNNYIQSIPVHKIGQSYDDENDQCILNISAAQLDTYLNQNTICFFVATIMEDSTTWYIPYYFATKQTIEAIQQARDANPSYVTYYIFKAGNGNSLSFCEQDGYLKTELVEDEPPLE